MKIRSLRPEFFADQKMAQLTPLARLLFQGMWCIADDYGRGRYLPKAIEGEVFPHEQVDIFALLRELLEMERIVVYGSGDEQFFVVPSFALHHRPSRKFESKLPPPPSTSHVVSAHNGLTTQAQRTHDVPEKPLSPLSSDNAQRKHNASTTYAHSVSLSLSLSLTLSPRDALERWASVKNIRPTGRWLRRWDEAATEFLEQHPDLTPERFDAFAKWASDKGVAVPGGWASWWPSWPQLTFAPPKNPDPNCEHCRGRGVVYLTDTGEDSEHVDNYAGPLTPRECVCLTAKQ